MENTSTQAVDTKETTYQAEVLTEEQFKDFKQKAFKSILSAHLRSYITGIIVLVAAIIVFFVDRPIGCILSIVSIVIYVCTLPKLIRLISLNEANRLERLLVFRTKCTGYNIDRSVEYDRDSDGKTHRRIYTNSYYTVENATEIQNKLQQYRCIIELDKFTALYDRQKGINRGIRGNSEEVYVVAVLNNNKDCIKDIGIMPLTFDWDTCQSEVHNETEESIVSERSLTEDEVNKYKSLCKVQSNGVVFETVAIAGFLILTGMIAIQAIFGTNISTLFTEYTMDDFMSLVQVGAHNIGNIITVVKLFIPYIFVLCVLLKAILHLNAVLSLESEKVISEIKVFEDICTDAKINVQNHSKSKYTTEHLASIIAYLNEQYGYKIDTKTSYLNGFCSGVKVKIAGTQEPVYVIAIKKRLYIVPRDFLWE